MMRGRLGMFLIGFFGLGGVFWLWMAPFLLRPLLGHELMWTVWEWGWGILSIALIAGAVLVISSGD